MKRIGIGLFLCILLMGFFVLPASAESAASRVDTYCTVSAEGDCQVNMTVTLRMEYVTTAMSFPLPANATGITLNGASVSTARHPPRPWSISAGWSAALPGRFP